MSTPLLEVQRRLQQAGLYKGKLDGDWGGGSEAAFQAGLAKGQDFALGLFDIAWSAKVEPAFTNRTLQIAALLKLERKGADELMSCMAFESGETFDPKKPNNAGAPYYGLIQFGEDAATDCGTTLAKLLKMTRLEQLECVYLYFKPLTGKIKNLGDMYLKILWPGGVGKSDDYVLWNKDARPKTYLQNRGLDINHDGDITRGECVAKVMEKYRRGMSPLFRRPL